jgi:hypothetical protein
VTLVTDAEQIVEETVSEDAPFGINPKTGRPYRRSPEERAAWAAKANAARWGSQPSRTTTSSGSARGRKPAQPKVDYRPGVIGLLQIPAFTLGIVAKYANSPALALDSATITLHAPNVAEALQQTAEQQAWLADLLDKVLQVGPYGALLGALMPVAMQVAANHGKVQPNSDLGILSEEELKLALLSQGQK